MFVCAVGEVGIDLHSEESALKRSTVNIAGSQVYYITHIVLSFHAESHCIPVSSYVVFCTFCIGCRRVCWPTLRVVSCLAVR